ncbi:MAG: hypothetical protein JRN08_06185 [Nitrososphaerota archaeon]|nr:hypothetical protein [Nitrososphaerota archaeon]
MRPALVAAGAALLVFGAALIMIAPIYVTTGLYKQEMQSISSPSSSFNSTKALQPFTDISDQAMEIAFGGAIVAAIGGAALAYGIAVKKPETPSAPVPT